MGWSPKKWTKQEDRKKGKKEKKEKEEYLQIHLPSKYIIDGIITEGADKLGTMYYRLKYSMDGVHFFCFGDDCSPKFGMMNKNYANSLSSQTVKPEIVNYVRYYPLRAIDSADRPVVRLELLGCKAP